jgi:putative SOS response-associated peptidase YedK
LREVVRAARSALTESDGRVAFEGRTKIRGRRSAGALITTDANELIAEIHDRMPLILAPGDYIRWLSDEPDPHDLMRPFPAEPMRIWPISTRVNKPENDEPSIREPLELASSAA